MENKPDNMKYVQMGSMMRRRYGPALRNASCISVGAAAASSNHQLRLLHEISSMGGEQDPNWTGARSEIATEFTREELGKIVEFFNSCMLHAQENRSLLTKNNPSRKNEGISEEIIPGPQPHAHPGKRAVAVFGSINVDLIAETATFPTPNTNQPGRDFNTFPGGKGANEAVACGLLGISCFMIGRVGRDDFGRQMLSELSHVTNIDGIMLDATESTGVAMIVKASDTKHKATTSCAAANLTIGDDEQQMLSLLFRDVSEVRFVLSQLEIAANAVLEAAKLSTLCGKIVAIRASPITHMDDFPAQLWDHTHILIVNEWETVILLGTEAAKKGNIPMPLKTLGQCAKAADMLMETHPRLFAVYVTTGYGAICRYKVDVANDLQKDNFDVNADIYENASRQTILVPLIRVKVVDYIGAADASTGAFIAALAHGAPFHHAVAWGLASGAISTQSTGAQSSMPELEDLAEFFSKNDMRIYLPDGTQAEDPSKPKWPSTDPVSPEFDEFKMRLLECSEDPHAFISALQHLGDDDFQQAIDFQGQTMLHTAVLHQNLPAVCVLLSRGADLFVRDRYGFTAMDRACESLCAKPNVDTTLAVVAFVTTWTVNACVNADDDDDTTALSEWEFKLGKADVFKRVSESLPCLGNQWPIDWGHMCLSLLMFGVVNSDFAPTDIPPSKLSLQASASLLLAKHLTTKVLEHLEKTASEAKIIRCVSVLSNATTIHGSGFYHAAALTADDVFLQQTYACLSSSNSATIKSFDHFNRSALHFGALAHAHTVCKFLLDKDVYLYDRDSSGRTPLDYCSDHEFAKVLGTLSQMQDTFISVGHTPATDAVVTKVAQGLEALGATVWWDKNPHRGITPGKSWRDEITKAMKHSKTAIVVLTQKWLTSQYCQAEANLALSFNKPIYTILPPVPKEEQASLNNISETNPLYHTLGHLQFFDFSKCTSDEEYAASCKSLLKAINTINLVDQREPLWNDDLSGITDVFQPTTALRHSLVNTDGYVLIACGIDATSTKTPFAQLLGRKLHKSGIPVVVASKPGKNDLTYWDKLNVSIEKASLVLAVLEEQGDKDHLNAVISVACARGTDYMMVPYAQLSYGGSGLGYTASFVGVETCCFTDWMGTDKGFTDKSPIFNEIFENFLHQIDRTLTTVYA
eukprot:m.198720 g.198720  ORF g.198720 m.198720 type:complete len:1151 (-) comp32703_c1_seq4:133-3585(-)